MPVRFLKRDFSMRCHYAHARTNHVIRSDDEKSNHSAVDDSCDYDRIGIGKRDDDVLLLVDCTPYFGIATIFMRQRQYSNATPNGREVAHSGRQKTVAIACIVAIQ